MIPVNIHLLPATVAYPEAELHPVQSAKTFALVVVIYTLFVYSKSILPQLLVGQVSRSTFTDNSASIIVFLSFVPCYVIFGISSFKRRSDLKVFYKALKLPVIICFFYILLALFYFRDIISVIKLSSLMATLIIAFYLGTKFNTEKFIRLAQKVLSFSMFVSVFYIHFVPSLGLMPFSQLSNLSGMPQGVFLHKNTLGNYAALCLLLTVCLYGARISASSLLSYGFCVYCLVLAKSSTSIAALAMALMIYVTLSTFKRIRFSLPVSTSILFIIGVVAAFLIYLYIDPLFKLIGRDASLTGRDLIWAFSLQTIQQSPLLGQGFDTFWSTDAAFTFARQIRLPFVAHSHSGILELALQLGIPMAALYLSWIAYQTIRASYQWYCNDNALASILFVLSLYLILRSIAEPAFLLSNEIANLIIFTLVARLNYDRIRGNYHDA